MVIFVQFVQNLPLGFFRLTSFLAPVRCFVWTTVTDKKLLFDHAKHVENIKCPALSANFYAALCCIYAAYMHFEHLPKLSLLSDKSRFLLLCNMHKMAILCTRSRRNEIVHFDMILLRKGRVTLIILLLILAL